VERALSSFRARILSSPVDLGLRQVYGDLLSERGDPRGAFITAQCLGLTAEAQALFEANRHHLMRPLGPYAKVVFRHGFIEEWTTDYLELRQGGRALLKTSPVRLLRVSGLKKNDLAYLFDSEGLENLLRLELTVLERSPFEYLRKRPLPLLQTLLVSGRFKRAELERFQSSALARQLKRLTASGHDGADQFEVETGG